MLSPNHVELIGLFAGGMIACASIPKILATLRGVPAGRESRSRNMMMLTGNALWVVYGVERHALPVTLFCSINTVLIACILLLPLLDRSRQGPATEAR